MDVPVYTQYQSPSLIAAIAYDGLDPATDPLWHQSGATSRDEYARWCRHLCGLACLQMVLASRDGRAPRLLDLLRGCLPYGVYVEEPDGRIRGMYYAPFVDYLELEHDLQGTVHPHLTIEELHDGLSRGRLVIASVHKEIRRPESDPPRKGGHLVLVTGHDDNRLHFRNPSGHTSDSRTATLNDADFARFFAGRGMSIAPHRSPSPSPTAR